jgi:adenylyl-sulfate kinase
MGHDSSTPGIAPVSAAERERRLGHRGAVVWLTGLPGSGKSTIGLGLERALFSRGVQAVVLDGDRLRSGLSADLTFSAADRAENLRRAAEVAALAADAGLVAIAALISPYRADRRRARQIAQWRVPRLAFVEVHVHAPLRVCQARDPKGLYARARTGGLDHVTGVSDPYEPPEQPELVLPTDVETVEQSVARCMELLLPLIAVGSEEVSGRPADAPRQVE